MKTSFGVLCIILLTTGICSIGYAGKFNQSPAAKESASPVPASQVEIFESGKPPVRKFEVISPLSSANYSSKSFQKAMQQAAGKLGADAVLGVHDFHAPRTVGIHLQSGIAVRWLSENQSPTDSPARSGLAYVVLLEAPIENENTFAEIRDTMLLIGGLQLYTMGYSPIYVSTPFPADAKAPAKITFDILKDSEARLCERMVVLRLTRRSQDYAGVAAKANIELIAQLISRSDNSCIWTHTNEIKKASIGIGGALNIGTTAFMGQAAAQTLKPMPKSQ
jgi:hypothetical protein